MKVPIGEVMIIAVMIICGKVIDYGYSQLKCGYTDYLKGKAIGAIVPGSDEAIKLQEQDNAKYPVK